MKKFSWSKTVRTKNDFSLTDNSSTSVEESSESRIRRSLQNDALDARFGFKRVEGNVQKVGWLLNMHSTEVMDENRRLVSAVDYYFLQEDGSRFKATLEYQPYFYVLPKSGYEQQVSLFLSKKYGSYVASVQLVAREDLDLRNHLVGLKQRYLKLFFVSVADLMKVRKDILPAVRKNKEREKSSSIYGGILKETYFEAGTGPEREKASSSSLDNIIDIREYDVPYHMRVAIDKGICSSVWYSVTLTSGKSLNPEIVKRSDLIEPPDCVVLAYDIETTKLPLKFPDRETDQIMMISYMIDGQGFLITNREIVSSDVADFEYSPSSEYEGHFIINNELNEKALIRRFFDHILEVRPHIFATYNGDFFDWPFLEARALVHGMSMFDEIGFSALSDGSYSSRPAIHMDCFNWVKRDSYLPIGSQNLKAVAKAKLRYNPVELDPEEMCRMATEKPQILANYSVSDAVATYYLYMKYVHPFIFALCTIIPMEPDEVLRKGSGTLCEALLMVEAFRVNVIYPNKQESVPHKMTENGHLLESETYVGGHVEALESGIFKADIQTRFKLDPEMFDQLIKGVNTALRHAIQVEKIPLDNVINFELVSSCIVDKLKRLRDAPLRTEYPVIYHLDVGAMYPNIILTNRLQPSAMVDEGVCAGCDFNKPSSRCQRSMEWTWRGEVVPASRAEFQRIQQQLQIEKFPPVLGSDTPRAFHQLTKEERAIFERKRISDYSKKVYRKAHVTHVEIRNQTVCQRENSFYVDTVRAFRNRRYEYKALNKAAKADVSFAIEGGDASVIKSAKNREVLYDSLQLAYKCILNSFYGYVMRRGSLRNTPGNYFELCINASLSVTSARWHSMEMAGIVCHTGSNIIKKARQIVERVGRPLELDTDGIWCILPSSFPQNYTIETTLENKPRMTISYPNAVLNQMVKDEFTNNDYHELVDSKSLQYEIRSENSILFEVDGPYLGMILPASKEEGKKLKKRYAVFNMDKTIAELKGFEIKRRGELQLIKIFQSSVFEAFLEGETLESCYASVAKVADYWLDVLYSKAEAMPDTELFELISENRSMSRKLEDYGEQKSTSISTAKRLSEFLGDQMVKDAGLSCRFIISRKPEGSPITERAIPLAIFQAESSVRKHFLRRWLKDNSIVELDIRNILDWNYYIERLGGAIQKIITIPAALQGVLNPVPRVPHPHWLHKRILEKADTLKQRKINEVYKKLPVSIIPKAGSGSGDNGKIVDIEDCRAASRPRIGGVAVQNEGKSRSIKAINKKKRGRSPVEELDLTKPWREVFGNPPATGSTRGEMQTWIRFQKRKWEFQWKQKAGRVKRARVNREENLFSRPIRPFTIGGFLKRSEQTLLNTPWQIIQIGQTGIPGLFRLWVLVGEDIHQLKLTIPRIFYMNYREPQPLEMGIDLHGNSVAVRKCRKILPRAHPVHNLYEFRVPEGLFQEEYKSIVGEMRRLAVEGIYETQVPLEFRAIVQLGNVCSVDRDAARKFRQVTNSFDLGQLNPANLTSKYLDLSLFSRVFLYQHKSWSKVYIGLLFFSTCKGVIYIVDTVRTNQMPANLTSIFNYQRNERLRKGDVESSLPNGDFTFEVHFETRIGNVYRLLQRQLLQYKEERRGPTLLCIQSDMTFPMWLSVVPACADYPMIPIHVSDSENAYNVLDWQRIATRILFAHCFRLNQVLDAVVRQCRYLGVPIGNMDPDPTLFGADLLFARELNKNGFLLWCSRTERPDLGGKEEDDNRLITDFEGMTSVVINKPGSYQSLTLELEIDGLAVDTLLQAPHVHDIEGTAATVAFDNLPQASLEEMMGNRPSPALANYDETALCSGAFRVLRTMVTNWLKDVSLNGNIMADYQLIHMYRWLRSSHSLLYDPALKHSLLNLMKKLFVQFVAEFMRLGSLIVYADFSKLIICTKKNRLEDGLSYVSYVTASIKSRELFHGIDVRVKEAWASLLWLDSTNFGGIRLKCLQNYTNHSKKNTRNSTEVEEGNKDGGHDEEGEEAEPLNLNVEEDEVELDMHWRLISYLPEVGNCKINFRTAIASYISAVYEHLRSELEGFTPGQTPVLKRNLAQTTSRGQDIQTAMSTVQFTRELLRGELSQQLFTIVQKLNKKYPTASNEGKAEDAVYKGNLMQRRGKPALEFVKIIHCVLSLDSNIADEAQKLRRNLLKLIGVGEFSDEACFVDPCLSVFVPEVICKFCILCRDIDLSKDENVRLESDLPVWFCPVCKTEYETSEIEQLLVETLNRKLMAYALQDLQCNKCQQIKQENMQLFCICAGSMKTVVDAGRCLQMLLAYHSLAAHFGMPLLLQNVDWALNMSKENPVT